MSSPNDGAAIQSFVHQRFVDLFLSQNRRAQLGLLVSALLVALICMQRTPAAIWLLWVGAVGVVMLVRLAFTERFVRQALDAARQTQRIVLVLCVNGLLLAAPLALFDRLSELERSALSIVLIASATASVATTSGYRLVFLAFAAPMLLPLGAAWAWVHRDSGGGWGAYAIAFLVWLFLAFLVSIARQAHRIFVEASQFRFGAQQLTEELKIALDEASEANRAKTQFLAAASHDLRQPIHSINVLVAALTLRELDPRTRQIATLLDSVNQTLSRQLDGLLDVSKLDAGTVTPELGVERLDELAATHHASLVPVARERGLDVLLQIEAEPSVRTDAGLLSRVLGNLSDNAIKFTPRGGRVTLGVRRDGDRAELWVADTGIGIAAAEQRNVFREFYQVANVERDRAKGLGLGLSIVQRLCRLLQIDLSLDSAPGQGTTLRLRMPCVASAGARELPGSVGRVPAGLSVLVVDDEAMVRESMRLLLLELGCTVHLADSTQQAADVAREARIDAVLTDFRLRGSDSGLAALAAVRASHPAARAALVTGDTAPDRIRDAKAAGVALLHKPVTMQDLVAVLAAHPG